MSYYLSRINSREKRVDLCVNHKSKCFYGNFKENKDQNKYIAPNIEEAVHIRNLVFSVTFEFYDIYDLVADWKVKIPEELLFNFSIDNEPELEKFKKQYPFLYESYIRAFEEWSKKEIDVTKITYRTLFRNDIYTGYTTHKCELKHPLFVNWRNSKVKAWINLNEKGKYISVIMPWEISHDGTYSYIKSKDKNELWGETGYFEGIISDSFRNFLNLKW